MNRNHVLVVVLFSAGLLLAGGCGGEQKQGPNLRQLTKDAMNRLRRIEARTRKAENDAPLDQQPAFNALRRKLVKIRIDAAGEQATGMLTMPLAAIKRMSIELDEVEKELQKVAAKKE